MNVLLLSSRFPWPSFSGDRARAAIWLAALENAAEVALVAPEGRVPPGSPRFRFHPARPSVACAAAGAWRVLRGHPLQTLLAAPYDWARAIARAQDDLGHFDATIVLLSRLDPLVRDLLPVGRHVLDAIDSLRRSMEERSRESRAWRWLWREESRRIARLEASASRTYDRVLVVSEGEEAAEMNALAISSGVVIRPLAERPRRYDFAFWGRLAYFANADAALWLLSEIWPAIRAQRPDATLFIGGADAPPRILAAHGRDGITVQSPVEDMAALARDARVALLPVRYGTGQSGKVLEAAEGGCAVVATRKAMRGLGGLMPHAVIADDAESLARAAIAMLDDEPRRAEQARRLRAAVEATYARQLTLQRLAAVVRGGEVAA